MQRAPELKTKVIGVPVTPKQFERFRAIARSEGRSLASWLRNIAIRAAETALR